MTKIKVRIFILDMNVKTGITENIGNLIARNQRMIFIKSSRRLTVASDGETFEELEAILAFESGNLAERELRQERL